MMKYYGKTDVGLVRDNNQDYFLIEKIDTCEREYTLTVVCDGMGGANGGNIASRTACETFVAEVKKVLCDAENRAQVEILMESAAQKANSAVYELALYDKTLQGMGTTLCAVLTDSKALYAISVGDSRFYIFAGGKIHQISHDHSYVQTLIDSGAITKEESKTHPNKNIITRAVGTEKTVECDLFLLDITAMPFEGFLLCSDGLTNFVSDSELNALFLQYTTVDEFVEAGIQKAKEAGGGDNITAAAGKKA